MGGLREERAERGMDEGLGREDEVRMDKWEREERLKRRNCVIVHGLEESQAVEGVERSEADQVLVSEMFRVMNCGEVRTDKVIRLGKKGVLMNGECARPRPLKLVLESEEMKAELLLKAKNLRKSKEGGWSRVFVHQDLTPKEREQRKAAWQGMRNRVEGREKMGGEEGLGEQGLEE